MKNLTLSIIFLFSLQTIQASICVKSIKKAKIQSRKQIRVYKKKAKRQKRMVKISNQIKKKISKKPGKYRSKVKGFLWSIFFLVLIAMAIIIGGIWLIILLSILGIFLILFILIIVAFNNFQMCNTNPTNESIIILK